MNGLRLSSSIKRWAAAGNNSAAGPKRATALPLRILGRLIEAQGMALFARSLDPITVSALAAISGSFAGVFSSTLSAWITQKHRDRRDTLAKRIAHREQLYSDFISESARAMVDAMQHKFEDPAKLTPVYALINRIRLSSPMKVVESAEQVAKTILATYSAPNLTAEEIQSGAAKRDDPLRQFGNICRRELESLRSGL
jgi:hypothetical protein